ncbi:MAG TPA: CDP-diacylglycerol--glycerol-3-phosphate 3-phosphatidyltransferase [Candidatus Babeliales bacterium]|jgi:CDP-diacylglycerol--glycerol-3-phosphate 3-phosphatidyltransferase|nr:CDP-diacylglycerol--glycerol-3-phosphate 3-phosphatidyltransferase [Candidatus Babeliales bacterium]
MISDFSHIASNITVPTYITLIRLCIAPIVLPIAFVGLLPFNNNIINGCVLFLFILFSLTDLIDGFLARYYYQETDLGRALDPIADKFLLYSCFIGLLAAGKIFFVWVIIFIGRDLFMMGLRQIALQYNFDLAVSAWGKVRTAIVMIYIGFLIIHPYQKLSLLQAPWWHMLEYFLLLISLLLTIWSMYSYYVTFVQEFTKRFNQLTKV